MSDLEPRPGEADIGVGRVGAAAKMQFDDDDNLIVMDHTWNKVWVINYHKDPAWLKPLK